MFREGKAVVLQAKKASLPDKATSFRRCDEAMRAYHPGADGGSLMLRNEGKKRCYVWKSRQKLGRFDEKSYFCTNSSCHAS